jgi:putative chitinase
VLGKDEPVGQQPAAPVPVNDMQRFFLYTLMQKQGLTLTSATDPVNPGNAQAIAMAMAQVQRECGFKPQSENLNYSAKRLRQVFPSRVKSDQFAQELAAAGPPAIGNTIYGGRYGNGRDEGYKYRGRGLIQLTFKGNYETYGGKAGVNVVDNPDLANDPEVANKLAVAYLTSKSINWADSSMSSLGGQFAKAVGYARQGGSETAKRVGIGQGFLQKLINGELTPLSSLTTTPPPGSGTLEIS